MYCVQDIRNMYHPMEKLYLTYFIKEKPVCDATNGHVTNLKLPIPHSKMT